MHEAWLKFASELPLPRTWPKKGYLSGDNYKRVKSRRQHQRPDRAQLDKHLKGMRDACLAAMYEARAAVARQDAR